MRSFRCHDLSRGTHASKPIRHPWRREVGNSRGRPKSAPMSAAEGVVRRDYARPSSHSRDTVHGDSAVQCRQPRARPRRCRPRPRASRPAHRPCSAVAAPVCRDGPRAGRARRDTASGTRTRAAAADAREWPALPQAQSPRVGRVGCVAHSVRAERGAPVRSRPDRAVSQLTRTPKPRRPRRGSGSRPSPPVRRPPARPSSGRPSRAPRRTSSSSSAATIGSIELASRPHDSFFPAAGARARAPMR